MKYFVVLYHQNGSAVPLLDKDGYLMELFDTEEAARVAGNDTLFGAHFGCQVLPWDGLRT